MFFRRALRTHVEFGQGMRDMARVAAGTAAWGLMTGVAMVKSGMSVAESLLMTLLVFAGSAQLAAIPLMMAAAPLWVIWAAAACVNLRFVVFSLHLRPYFAHLPWWERMTHGYLTGDLSYVLFTRRFEHPSEDPAQRLRQEAYFAGGCCISWVSWMIASAIGVMLANLIPTHWGLGFAGILCLVGIASSLATTRLRLMAAAVAAITAVMVYALPLKLNIVLAIAVAVLACLSIENRKWK